MKLAMFALFLCMPLAGCASYRQYSQCETPVSRTVALMPFSSVAGGTAGEQAANRVALDLVEKGYVVIDSSFTTATVSETKFYASGLSNEVRSALLAHKLTALVFGSVNEFACETMRYTTLYGNQDSKNRCTVSLAAKMVDTATGKLLWGLTLADSAEGKNLTAGELMSSLIRRASIAATLPVPAAEAKEPEKQPEQAKQPEPVKQPVPAK